MNPLLSNDETMFKSYPHVRMIISICSITGAIAQVVQTAVCPHVSLELFDTPIRSNGISSAQRFTARWSMPPVLQVCNESGIPKSYR